MKLAFLEKVRRFKLPEVHFPGIFFVFPDRSASGGQKSGQSVNDEFSKFEVSNPPALVLDTSAIIDGRIADIVQTGFVDGTLVVCSGVLQELQRIADSENSLKRNRGRRGLEILEELKRGKSLELQLVEYGVTNQEDIDVSILRLAKELGGKVITTDYNLNKVAKVSGVPILNVNELANMVKTVILPGEALTLKVIQEGRGKGQGVGYLPDGTMVVVERGTQFIGEEVEVEVKRLLQTDAGRMIFAEVA